MAELLYPEESYAIVGAGFEVYRDKGCGFLEAVYHESFCIIFIHFVCFVCFVGRTVTLSKENRKERADFE